MKLMTFPRFAAAAAVGASMFVLAGCSHSTSSSPSSPAPTKAHIAAKQSHVEPCAEIATWTEHVYDEDGTPTSPPAVSGSAPSLVDV
jgi:hypothetical protein